MSLRNEVDPVNKSRGVEVGGFTLIELLIALAIFAILATLTSFIMIDAFKTKDRISAQASALHHLQMTFLIFKQDTLNATERPVRGDEMRLFPPFIGQANYLEFTRDGRLNPNHLKQSTLLRVGYLCKNNQFVRRTWLSVDSPDRKKYTDRVLLENLTTCQFSYINRASQTLDEWRSYAVSVNQQQEFLPQAINLTLGLAEKGNIALLFILPGAHHELS